MSGDRLNNDLLLQIAEEQAKQGKTLARLEGNMEARVSSLETTNKRQWYVHAVQAMILGALGTAKKFGII